MPKITLILNITKEELKTRWKQMYRKRKDCNNSEYAMTNQGIYTDGYLSGKMEYTAWLILNAKENQDDNPRNA